MKTRTMAATAASALLLALVPASGARADSGVSVRVTVQGSWATTLKVCATATATSGSTPVGLVLEVEGLATNGFDHYPMSAAPSRVLGPSSATVCSPVFEPQGRAYGALRAGAYATTASVPGAATASCQAAYAWAATGLTTSPVVVSDTC